MKGIEKKAMLAKRTYAADSLKQSQKRAYKAAECHTLHQPRNVAITLRMHTTVLAWQVSGNHGQLFQNSQATSALLGRYSQRRVFSTSLSGNSTLQNNS